MKEGGIMLYGLEEPARPEHLDEKTCDRIAELLRKYLPSANGIQRNATRSHWQEVADKSILFLGRNDAGTVVALGCMSICHTMTARIARIEEVVIDEKLCDLRVPSAILFRLTSWAGVINQVDCIELDDRICIVPEWILREAMFSRRTPRSHHLRCVVPSDEEK
jgi:hypothetical protein